MQYYSQELPTLQTQHSDMMAAPCQIAVDESHTGKLAHYLPEEEWLDPDGRAKAI